MIVVSCASRHFRVDQRFIEIPRQGVAHIEVLFTPQPAHEGLLTGQMVRPRHTSHASHASQLQRAQLGVPSR